MSDSGKTRSFWLQTLQGICIPVLNAAASDELKVRMPVHANHARYQHLEALGRIVYGIAPWLEINKGSPEEVSLRLSMRKKTVMAISNLLNPLASSHVDFGDGPQALVDAAYLCGGLLRSPTLLSLLPPQTSENLVRELLKTRTVFPPENNWLLFGSTVESLLLELGCIPDLSRLEKPVNNFVNHYYVGDGCYGDGRHFHLDYYNSYVIHPMLYDTLEVMKQHGLSHAETLQKTHTQRFTRLAELQERLISPEGTYPVIGRTLSCRFGAFHALSYAALKQLLPASLPPAQVRCALNAVLQRHCSSSVNYDDQGFLTVGFNGNQSGIAENYISTGSSYHCTTIFCALGLSPNEPFWNDPDCDWTSRKAYAGLDFPLDEPYDEVKGMRKISGTFLWLSKKWLRGKLMK